MQKGTAEDTRKSILIIVIIIIEIIPSTLSLKKTHKHTKLENMIISALSLSVLFFLLVEIKTNYFFS